MFALARTTEKVGRDEKIDDCDAMRCGADKAKGKRQKLSCDPASKFPAVARSRKKKLG